jgi:hypothetical protein
MERFLIVYRGAPGDTPEASEHNPERWTSWLNSLGSAVVDRGSLTHSSVEIPSRLIGPKLSSSSLSGYTLLQADDFNAVVRMTEACPIFDEHGAVEIARLTESMR